MKVNQSDRSDLLQAYLSPGSVRLDLPRAVVCVLCITSIRFHRVANIFHAKSGLFGGQAVGAGPVLSNLNFLFHFSWFG